MIYTNFEMLCSDYPAGRTKTALNKLKTCLKSLTSEGKRHNDHIKSYILKLYNPNPYITKEEKTDFMNALIFYAPNNRLLGIVAIVIGLALVAGGFGLIGVAGAYIFGGGVAMLGATCITAGVGCLCNANKHSIYTNTQKVIELAPTLTM